MELWVDSADVEAVKRVVSLGVVDGATTNPTLFARQSNRNFAEVVKQIAEIVKGPVSAEAVAMDYAGIIKEAQAISKIHENVVVKVPCTEGGLRALKYCKEHGIKTNFTPTFSINQVLLAAKAGATYTNIFLGRIDDAGHDGMQALAEALQMLKNYDFETKLIAASVRHPLHVARAAVLGCHVATVPPEVIEKMLKSPYTELGLKKFLDDWKKAGGKIEV